MQNSIPCNLCGGSDAEEIGLMDRDSNYLRTVICRNCGLVWSDPRPNEDEIRSYYSKDYRIEYKGTLTPKLKHVYRAGRIAEHRFRQVADLITPGARVLDVGAGGGEFVFLMRKRGFDASGIEPNEGYGRFAQEHLELPIRVGFAQQIKPADGRFTLVTMHHVLEHLDDPAFVLGKLYESISDDGFLAIEVPNVEGTCFAPIHRFHQAHLYNFNNKTLEAIGKNAGFNVIRSEMSDDGGVIRTIFNRTDEKPEPVKVIAGNYDRIASIIRRHTPASHYLTVHPYVRPFSRLQMNLAEKEGTKGCTDAYSVLEKLFGTAA
ncbi:MAG: class I SAM-dependent methyltransferase [Pyrinomonadaceae bacterium]